MKIEVVRDVFNPDFTLGVLSYDGIKLGYTCEDTDRKLEFDISAKIDKQTAIPRGEYAVVMSQSKRFGIVMPEILHVPGFTGVRIHGGNTSADTEGCILLGLQRTVDGCANCSVANSILRQLLISEEAAGRKSTIVVR